VGGRPEIEAVNAGKAEQAELRPPDRSPELHGRLAVRRRLTVRPVSRGDAETGDLVNVEAALGAVEDERLEFALQLLLHVQQLEPEHLRVNGDRMGAVEPGVERLVDKVVGIRGLLDDGAGSSLARESASEDQDAAVRGAGGTQVPEPVSLGSRSRVAE